MRVLRVLASLDPATGGPPSVFSAAVIATAAAGAAIECLTVRPPGAEIRDFPDYQRLVANGIKVHTARNFLSACLLVYRRSRNFDIIHVDGCWVPISILAVLIAKLTGRRSAATPHETLTFEERRRTRSRLRAFAKRLLSYYYIKLADCIVYSSALEERDSPRHRNSVVIPHPVHEDMMVYDDDVQRVGYATSFMYSPVLQRHIGMARVQPQYAAPDSEVHVEITIDHAYQRARAYTARVPLFNPERKTATP